MTEAPPDRSAENPGNRRLPETDTSGENAPGDFPIVGLGASAGGLQAFAGFLDAVSPDCRMAFVLIQHLDPEHESLLASLLSSHTGMTVLPAEDGQRVVPEHVYVIPPKTTLLLEQGTLRLSAPDERHGARLPVDAFFRSLADDRQGRAIGIVLSGTGSDGTRGLTMIREAGGLTMVQDPYEAAFDGMPRSAMSHGVVDHVMGVRDMPAALAGYVAHPYFRTGGTQRVLGDRARDILGDVVTALKNHTRINFELYKEGTLLRRIERRMGVAHLGDGAAYLALLKQDPAELERLYKDLLINVTGYFRDRATVEHLAKTVLPDVVRQHAGDRSFRAWVAGCATGEEAYSIAMLLIEQAELQGRRLKIQIFATDLDEDSLAVARGGIYPESIEGDVSAERLKRFFIKEDHTWQVTPELRETIVFAQHDLLSDAPFSRLDMVTCRNVLIYLEPRIQNRIIEMFHFGLNSHGILLLGASETLTGEDDLFEIVSREHRIYRQRGVRRRPARLGSGGLPSRVLPGMSAVPNPAAARAAGELPRLTQRLLLERHAPTAVLLDRRFQALYFSGPIDDYVKVPTGEAGQDVLAMVREGLRVELRAIGQAVLASGQPAKSDGAAVVLDGVRRTVIMTAESVEYGDEKLLLVTFTDAEEAQLGTAATDASDRSTVEQLEIELENTRRELNVTIRDLETSNEELKAANEEALSMNEEFQSTNEELETSREELQSLNEELTTLNSQLQQKVDEHRGVVSDLNNLLNSAQIATLFLDAELCIKRFTPSVRDLFSLIVSDIGRPFEDIARKFDDADLHRIVSDVLASHVPVETEVQSHSGRWYLRRVLTYRTPSNGVDGVVITFHEVTELKRTEQSAVEAQRYAEAIIGTVREPLVVLDASMVVVSASESFLAKYATTAADTVGRSFFEILDARWALVELRQALERESLEDVLIEDFELDESAIGNGESTLSFSARRIEGDGTRKDLLLLAIENITERRIAERRIEEQNARLNSILESAQVGIVTTDEQGIVGSFSRTAELLFGYSAAEVIGRNVTLLMPDAERETHDGHMAAYLETGVRHVIGRGREVIGQHKGGRLIPLDISIGEAWVQGERLFTGVMRDITSEKKRQEELRQAQKMDAMGQLTGGVAHDFNNLLTVITGNLELLGDERWAGQRSDLLAEAGEAARLGSELTADLLAFGRRIPMRTEVIDLNDLVVQFTGMLRRTLPESIRMDTELADGLCSIASDTAQVQNALLNLVLNARDAMPAGGSLTIRTRNVTPGADESGSGADVGPGDFVALAVEDTGTGMPAAVQKRAFEPFYTTKEVGQGSGLGLSMIYGFVRQSGGHVSIRSAAGQGTAVTLYLPRRDSESSVAVRGLVARDNGPVSGERILVVEDDSRVRRLTVKRLEAIGYSVLQADSGAAALQILAERSDVDLMFSDVIMPGGMSGIDLAVTVRGLYPELRVLLTSGYTAEALDIEYEAMILNKPYTTANLAAKIREALDAT